MKIDDILNDALPSASKEQIESARLEVYDYARSSVAEGRDDSVIARFPRFPWRRVAMIPAAAAIVLTILIGLLWRQDALAIGEGEDGSRYRIGDTVRTNSGLIIKLKDGTRVEVSSESELSFEGDKSAVEIRLTRGGVLVYSETQPVVKTKDMKVSIAGTVQVNAESMGSRVAVLQGEARVQQGSVGKTLRPGEQIAPGSERRAAFEVVSIRPFVASPQSGERQGGPGAPTPVACPYIGTRIDPARITAPRITAFRLITWAYEPRGCVLEMGLVAGEPDWTRTDLYAFEATMPVGTPAYGLMQLQRGEAPKLQEMMQTTLEERFKLKFHREKKEVAAYDLVVAKPGRMTPSKDQTPPPDPFAGSRGPVALGSDGLPPGLPYLSLDRFQGTSITVSDLARGWSSLAARPIVDKTGLTGFFDINVPITKLDLTQLPGRGRGGTLAGTGLPPYEAEIMEALGLKLQSSKTTVDIIVIDHIEKPSEN